MLSKKGQAGVGGKTVAVIVGVISVVILFAAAPELWTVLDDAIGNITAADIPLVSGMGGIIGLIFGAAILLGALYGLFRLIGNRR